MSHSLVGQAAEKSLMLPSLDVATVLGGAVRLHLVNQLVNHVAGDAMRMKADILKAEF